ncbi:nuclear body protein SP140-like protein [Rhineura floridana]|uniref:nuclear body protein SP140-like protein n=1 Tax=Rhineura floridana TaxID=261503 RepID=UPI002AC7F4D1|nr:nuclear body protein SP140-like protein [Rhineura floridana]XP_061490396.1 nuclear body protein SP140-like protein [Rhineura floridana]
MANPSTSNEILKWFRAHKVLISDAINDLFPFLYVLRDKQIISEEEFKNCQDKVDSNPNGIHKAVYEVLENIKTNVSAVMEVFSKENLKKHQDLQPLHSSLQNVLQPAGNNSATEPGSSNLLQTNKDNSESSIRKEGEKMQNQKKQNLVVQVQRLKVTCGKSKGFLYKTKLETGPGSPKCIKASNGNWYTLREFVIKGGHASWKSWRSSIQYNGLPLEKLIKWGDVLNLYQRRLRIKKTKTGTVNVADHGMTPPSQHPLSSQPQCAACKEGGSLVCCCSCSRFFHCFCHVPQESAGKRKKWKCTLCKLEMHCAAYSLSDDQVLKLKIIGKNTLKCAFLLLKIWCEPKSFHFADKPTTGQKIAEDGRELQNEFEKSFDEVFLFCN